MPNCDNCGSFVTADFVRVFGDADGIDGCPFCEKDHRHHPTYTDSRGPGRGQAGNVDAKNAAVEDVRE
jgi:hypothetical protein